MNNQDFFHDIAKTKHPIDSTDREIMPIEITNHCLPRSDQTFLRRIEEISYEEQKEKFQKDLQKLRVHYRPFMKNYLQSIKENTEKIYFKEFSFRYVEKGECFSERNEPGKTWEAVTIPDYRGPAGVDGKWDAYYKKSFSCPKEWKEMVICGYHITLDFQCVDYIAWIYLNGNFVGSHEGLFAPFAIDITKFIKEENELIILCRNDISILGEGEFLDGDKIYAATGPGWDDPKMGWHHCPAGAGVFGKVSLELRPSLYIEDIFVRPDMKSKLAEVRIGIMNYTDEVKNNLQLTLEMNPKNYQGDPIGSGEFVITAMGSGKNEYRYFIPIDNYRLWEADAPWLYGASVILKKDEDIISGRMQTFGLKTFISDETSKPKGRFYMNGNPMVLRGGNEMGHLQQCVMNEDFEQLIDDILIAKLCNLNYYRITQRPVQEEIYDYFDMLGMMHQCDFPLFGFLRRPQFSEAIRQVTEMEHLVRKHVSTVMTTFINEPMCIRKTKDPKDKFSRRYEAKGHRHLLRDELEAFFSAARKAVYIENPDRVIKNVEGDYDGPTAEGMPDFHTYTMWYTNHGQPIGKLMRGYLPPVKTGWMIGCGEYGAEGLDPEDVMMKYYPKEWITCNESGKWYPDKIVRAQTHSVQGDWFKEQDNMKDWVKASQIHQARATKLLTDAFRRRGDVINQTAIHLLIDAWPSGWMKTLLDFKRTPKRAYFAYQEALIPLKINLYTGRNYAYEDETVPVEIWVLNDTSKTEELGIQAEIWEEGEENPYDAFGESFSINGADAQCAGILPVTFLRKEQDRVVVIQAAIFDKTGNLIHQEKITIQVYSRKVLQNSIYTVGEEAFSMAETYGLSQAEKSQMWLMSSLEEEEILKLKEHLVNGGDALWLLPEDKMEINFDGTVIRTKSCGDLFFLAVDGVYEEYPISMVYNNKKGYIDSTAAFTVDTNIPGETLLYTYEKQGFAGNYGAKRHLPVVKSCMVGKGRLLLCSLARDGRVGYNGGLDRLFLAFLNDGVR